MRQFRVLRLLLLIWLVFGFFTQDPNLSKISALSTMLSLIEQIREPKHKLSDSNLESD